LINYNYLFPETADHNNNSHHYFNRWHFLFNLKL